MPSPFKNGLLESRRFLAKTIIGLATLILSCGDIYSDLVENEGFPCIQSPFQFVEDWESGSDGWIDDAGAGGDWWSITSAVFVSGNNSLEMMAETNWNYYDGLHYEFEKAIRPVYISFYIRKSTEANFPMINFGGGTIPGNDGSICYKWDDAWGNGTSFPNVMYVTDVFGNKHLSGQIMAGAFHLVEFRNINFSTQTYDFYVDGSLVAPLVLFRNPAFAFTRLYISLGWYASYTYIDDIIITGYELLPM